MGETPIRSIDDTLTINEAFTAWEHAQEAITGCESIDEIDTASNYREAMDNCPKGFTLAQRGLAHAKTSCEHTRTRLAEPSGGVPVCFEATRSSREQSRSKQRKGTHDEIG
jgi:hypothetical protein